VSTPDLSLRDAYINKLAKEIERCDFVPNGATVDSVYIGGGTPSCLDRGGLARIFSALRNKFDITHNAEMTVEANPESCTRAFADECGEAGVNRISLGLQSSDDSILRKIGRVHDLDMFLSAVKTLRSCGFTNISSDVILGLPTQDASDVVSAVSVISEYCTHASVYALTVEEGTRLHADGYMPDDDFVADLYDTACEKLAAAGFMRYEVSNFARGGAESRHNMKYWNCEPYLGFGAAAHGYDGKRMRYSHTNDICGYISGADLNCTPLTTDDIYNEYIMLRLRTEKGVNFSELEKRCGQSALERFLRTLEQYEKSGIMISDGSSAHISADKMFVMNGIIEDFMV